MTDLIHIVCGGCESVVRVPREKMRDSPRCPKCRNPLLPGAPLELHQSNFEQHLTRNDLPLVVDMWAPWCGPCRMMAPNFDAAAERFALRARFGKVNSDEEPSLAARFGIRGIPTLLVFRDGREIARQSGAMNAATLDRWLTAALSQDSRAFGDVMR